MCIFSHRYRKSNVKNCIFLNLHTCLMMHTQPLSVNRLHAVWLVLSAAVLASLMCACTGPETAEERNRDALDNELRELDRDFNVRDTALARRRQNIESVKRAARGNRRSQAFREVGRAYEYVENDSALYYYRLAFNAADSLSANARVAQARYAMLLPLAGFVDEAVRTLEDIDTTGLSAEDKADIYESGRQMYANIAQFYDHYSDISRMWSQRASDYQFRLLKALGQTRDNNRYRLSHGEYLLDTGRSDLAEPLLREVFESEPESSELYRRAAYLLSRLSARRDRVAQARYLICSVRSCLMNGDVELPPLQDLGMALHELGDEPRADRFLNIAISNASSAGADLRLVNVAAAVPLVQESHLSSLERSRKTLYWVIAALVVALLTLAGMVLYLRKRSQRLARLQARLTAANLTKEQYIKQFLQLCSVYMDRLMQFSSMVQRKLAAGKIDDLTRLVHNGKYVNEQNADFFEVFDKAFLNMYPTFVDDVNRLLREDKRIMLDGPEKLNSDLRILAFMRMGIDDSSRIAQILNYSVNTIYAYRNKLKMRAINTSTFEADVMRIPSI